MRVTALAGGVGAARFLIGLMAVVDPSSITAIVNTGDDVELHGLWISPDLDTVTYTLADAVNPATGWGLVDETWATMDALARYRPQAPPGSTAGGTWFRLGDKDLGLHLYRTRRRDEGAPLSTITAEVAAAWGLNLRILPMSDDTVQTMVTIRGEGEVGFQDYFVGRQHSVPVSAIRFSGAAMAAPAPDVISSIDSADTVIICPSNPLVSIGPIRAVPGIEAALASVRERVIAVSPIVGGAALKGPADQMLASLGHEVSVVGVARIYAPIASTLVIDTVDAALADAVEAEGLACVVTPTVMTTPAIAATLASRVLVGS
jgi:LPPG:FO 2-phospho-L-lactate transferase